MREAEGLILAESIRADRDYPPFDKSQMDGYAVRAADVPGELRVVGEIAAGAIAARGLADREAMSIMTGAPLLSGADAVVPVEETERSGDMVRIARPTTSAAGRGPKWRLSRLTFGLSPRRSNPPVGETCSTRLTPNLRGASGSRNTTMSPGLGRNHRPMTSLSPGRRAGSMLVSSTMKRATGRIGENILRV